MKTANIIKITSDMVQDVISTIPKGAFFTVEFTKKDGSNRVMNCRTGVTAHLVPADQKKRERPVMPTNLVTVFDVKSNEYRMFNKNTTKKIVAEKKTYVVEG